MLHYALFRSSILNCRLLEFELIRGTEIDSQIRSSVLNLLLSSLSSISFLYSLYRPEFHPEKYIRSNVTANNIGYSVRAKKKRKRDVAVGIGI